MKQIAHDPFFAFQAMENCLHFLPRQDDGQLLGLLCLHHIAKISGVLA